MAGKKQTKSRTEQSTSAIDPAVATSNLLGEVLSNPPEQFYIKYPSSDLSDYPDNLPNLYAPVVLDDQILALAGRLRTLEKTYKKTLDGTFLINAFLLTSECKLYPPIWVLNTLSLIFKNFLKAPKANSIDAWLGLKPNHGRNRRFKDFARDALFKEFAVRRLGLTRRQSIGAFEEKFDVAPMPTILTNTPPLESPADAVNNDRRRLKEIVGLLNEPEFIKDSSQYQDHYRAHAQKIGDDRIEWDRLEQAFITQFLDPFTDKWQAYPLPSELLSPSLWQKTNTATMNGQWGILPIYPWTTQKEVQHSLKTIQRAIGKQHHDFKAYRQALTAKWLRDCYISTRTGQPPSLSEIATFLWGSSNGLKRPSKKKAMSDLSEEREKQLMKRYLDKGKTYQEAERLVYKNARGKEAPAVAMVRMALKRIEKDQRGDDGLVTDVRKTDLLGLAVTMLLRELPTSASSTPDLNAIRDKAVELGNKLLPPSKPLL